MTQIQLMTILTTASTTPISPTPIAQAEPPTDTITAIAILISILLGSLTGLIQAITIAKKSV
jgi:hypothetical protein